MPVPLGAEARVIRRPRVLLLGAGGQLGVQLSRELRHGYELTALTRAELDLADAEGLRRAVRLWQPEIVINAGAYTAVDKAESESELAGKINAIGPGVLGEELKQTNGWLIHYSTDYVFDGTSNRPWVETDPTGPLSVYGKTKLDGELAIAASGCRHVILRTSWVYAAEGRNFLHTMLRLGGERERLSIVDDQVGAPTSAVALTAATDSVLHHLGQADDSADASGTYHLACAGATSWCGFAEAIFREFRSRQRAPEVLPIPSSAYPTPARRPLNSRLCCDKFTARFGFAMPSWDVALHQVATTMLAVEKDVVGQF